VQKRPRPYFLLLIAALLCGCAVLPLESSKVPHFSSRMPAAVAHGYREAIGVIHAHSTASDGQLPPDAIARIADRQGLDFLILTDHNTLNPKAEGKEGRYGRTLMLAGDEISTAHGHYLALRLREEVKSREASQWTADQVASQGGLGFIPHPFWKRKPWSNPALKGFTGIEIYNAAEDARNKNPAMLGAATLLEGSDLSVGHWVARLDQPLALWDRLLSGGRQVVGIGGADAHGLVRFGLRLAPYSTIFKLVRNHLLIMGEVTEASVYEALEKGHLFVAHDVIADASGFLFAAVGPDGAVRGIMGDRVKREPGLKLYAHLPSPGETRFLKDAKRWPGWPGRRAGWQWMGLACTGWKLPARPSPGSTAIRST